MGSVLVPSEKPRITLYLSQELKSAVELWAESESRPVSSQIGHLLNRLLIEQLIFVIDLPEALRENLAALAQKREMSVDTLIVSLLYESLNKEK